VPTPPRTSAAFAEIVRLARRLAETPDDEAASLALQVEVARLYGLSSSEFRHVLETFPLIDAGFRRRCCEAL
jgi:hypothetical protein